MANDNEILKRIKEKAGIDMTKCVDFDILAQAIKDKTNESLGVNTLKRFFVTRQRKSCRDFLQWM